VILDSGICTVFRDVNLSDNGDMPRRAYARVYQSWYGELSFETSPVRPSEGREELRTDARIRVLQNRTLRQGDVVALEALTDFFDRDPDRPIYRITRAYHGVDDAGPTEISDLSLEVTEP